MHQKNGTRMLKKMSKTNPGLQPQKKESSSAGGAAIVFVIFFLLGLGLSFWGWRIVQDARASTTWPQAQGMVLRSQVAHHSDGDGGDSYSPEVTYMYLAGKRYYESHTIKFGENSYDSKGQAQAVIKRYPIGQKVTVYYDPTKPAKAVLEPGVTVGSYIILGIGALFVVISLIIPPFALYLHRLNG